MIRHFLWKFTFKYYFSAFGGMEFQAKMLQLLMLGTDLEKVVNHPQAVNSAFYNVLTLIRLEDLFVDKWNLWTIWSHQHYDNNVVKLNNVLKIAWFATMNEQKYVWKMLLWPYMEKGADTRTFFIIIYIVLIFSFFIRAMAGCQLSWIFTFTL